MGRKKSVSRVNTTPVQAEDNGDETAQSASEKESTRNTSNPPSYAIMGTNPQTGGLQIVWREPTIGRIRKAFKNVLQGFGTVYSDLHIVRIKRLSQNGVGE